MGAEFRSDLAAFMDDELVDQCVDRERPRELPPNPKHRYVAFVDPSGGRADFYTICIGHRDESRFVVDVIQGRAPPFNPADVTSEFARLAQDYGVSKVTGDNFAAEWCSTAWRDNSMDYQRSEMPASQLAIEALPTFARGSISLPDHAVLLRELKNLERRTSRSGRDSVSHPPGLHDDHCAAVFGALRMAVRPANGLSSGSYGYGGTASILRGTPRGPGPWFPPAPPPTPRLVPLGWSHPADPHEKRRPNAGYLRGTF